MNCKFLVVLTLCFTLAAGFLHAGERTIPVDMILMIDKSLSMDETGKFDSLRQWVRDQLVSQMLIEGDWVAVFQFYEQPDQLLETTIAGPDTIEKIAQTINEIKPDGPFTDIGAALDAIRDAIEPRTQNGRHKVMLLLTDLRQEAPWSSRYAGVQDTYSSPYLARARIIEHDRWYEITLDMDIQNEVARKSRSIYSLITDDHNRTLEEASLFDRVDTALQGDAETDQKADPAHRTGNNASGAPAAHSGSAETDTAQDKTDTTQDKTGADAAGSFSGKNTLPQQTVFVLVCAGILAAAALSGVLLYRKKKQSRQVT